MLRMAVHLVEVARNVDIAEAFDIDAIPGVGAVDVADTVDACGL